MSPWMTLVLLMGLAGGCEDTAQKEYSPDPDIFVPDIPEDKVLTVDVTSEDGSRTWTVRFPVNEIMIALSEGSGTARARQVAETLDGTLVGQIPSLDIYEVEVASQDLEELERIVDRAGNIPDVERVGPDLFGQAFGASKLDACLGKGDNQKLKGEMRCTFDNTDTYSGMPVMEALQKEGVFHDVRLAVIDTGLNEGDQFGQAHFINLDGKTYNIDVDPIEHGTMVTSVIAADEGDGSIAGLASSVLGSKLSVYVGSAPHFRLMRVLAQAEQAVTRGNVRLINLSLGWWVTKNSPRWSGAKVAQIGLYWRRFLRKHPDVVVVAAAPNSGLDLTQYPEVPAGLDEPNLITVAGVEACDLDKPYKDTSFGPSVDIRAPAWRVAVMNPGDPSGAPILSSGNSYATPRVTSVVALLMAMRPDITVDDVRRYLLDWSIPCHGDPADPDLVTSCLDTARPVMALAFEEGRGESFLDGDMNGEVDPVGLVSQRFCSETTVDVVGVASFGCGESDSTEMEGCGGSINGQQVVLVIRSESGGDSYQLDLTVTRPFQPGVEYHLSGDGNAVFTWVSDTGQQGFSGTSPDEGGGTIRFTRCAILERQHLPGMSYPMLIELEGVYEGLLEGSMFGETEVVTKVASAYFRLQVPVMLPQPEDAELMETLETRCWNGDLELE